MQAIFSRSGRTLGRDGARVPALAKSSAASRGSLLTRVVRQWPAIAVILMAADAIALTSQTITFAKLSNKTYGAAPFTVSATASSGLPVSFTSTTTTVCTVSGNVVTIIAAGTCTIRASQAGNATYAAAPNVNKSFTVAKASQTITFAAITGKTFDASPLAVSATASSGLPVTFTSTTTSICTVAGSSVTFVKPGTCTIRAAQAGNSNYNAASNVNQSFTIAKGNQTISFSPLADRMIGTPPFQLTATASSGLPVTYSNFGSVACTVSGSTVTIVAVGSCTLRASQAGNANWNGAPIVFMSFEVTPALQAQSITFNALGDRTIGTAPFAVSATASSGLTVTFASLTAPVCTVSGNTVTMVAVGVCTIRASQAGNATFAAAPNVDRSFNVTMASQTITFDALAGQTLGSPPFAVSATASSGLAVSFSSLATGVCTVSGNTVTLLAAGTCTIRASQAGNATFAAAPNVDQSFVVTAVMTSTTLLSSSLNPAPAGGTVTFTATVSGSAPSGTVNFTDAGVSIAGCAAAPLTVGNPSTATCSTSGLAMGTHSVVASYGGDSNNAASASAPLAQVVNTAQPSGNTLVQYTYDAVGNIVAIRSSGTQLAITGFSPGSGPVGAVVAITGTGFSLTPSGNTVKFNGIPATVASAGNTQLTVNVPAGATTGPISVTIGSNTVTSATPFTVTLDYGPPTIASITPNVAAAGTSISIAGSNFNPTPANNTVRVGAVAATVVSATSANLVVTVPTGTGSGHVQVTTPQGSATSGGFVFIPPSPFAVGDVFHASAGPLDTSTVVTVNGPVKAGLIAFDIVTPRWVGIFGTASTLASGTLRLYGPNGAQIDSRPISTGGSTIPMLLLSQPGTYTVAVVSGSGSAGSITVTPGGPDLVVLDNPAPAILGITANQNGAYAIQVSYTVKNVGSATAQPISVQLWYDRAYLSTDGTLDNGDQELTGSPLRSTPLAPGATYSVTATFVTNGVTPAGTHTLFIKADGHGPTSGTGTNTDSGSVAEIDDTNNTRSLPITLNGPDLVVTNVNVDNLVANQNGSYGFIVSYTVANNGGLTAPSPWYDMAYLSTDGTLENADQHLNGWAFHNTPLAPGATYNVTQTFTSNGVTPAGNYTLFVKADGHGPLFGNGTNTDAGSVIETNDANNTRTAAVTLARPDLVVTAAAITGTVKNGNGSYTVSVNYTVQNNSTVIAQPPWYDMAYLSTDATLDNADGHFTGWPFRNTALAPGATYTTTGAFTTGANAPPGNYTLFIKADGHGPSFGNGTITDAGSLIEANDANNTFALPITLAP